MDVPPANGMKMDDKTEIWTMQLVKILLMDHARCILLKLQVVKSSKSASLFKPLQTPLKIPQQCSGGRMTWPQIVDFIGESNFNYVWEQPQISLLSKEYSASSSIEEGVKVRPSSVQMEECLYLDKLLKSIYINVEESVQKTSEDGEETEVNRFPVSNLCQAMSIITIGLSGSSSSRDSGGADISSFSLIFHPYIPYSLQDVINFSPQKLGSTARQMFVTYQLLQFLRDFQSVDLPLGDLNLENIRIDECLYLNVIPSITDILEHSKLIVKPCQSVMADSQIQDAVKCILKKVKGWEEYGQTNNSIHGSVLLEPRLIEYIIRHWCEGRINNYEYLMFLNYLCGRTCNGNPNYHPVFPWVADFSQPNGGWRDLTKSKFRLNKGERQLDIMYEDIGSNDKTVSSALHF